MLNHQNTQSAWPEGVVARYLTAGTATVDVKDAGVLSKSQGRMFDRSVFASCTGCASPVGEKTRRAWYADQSEPDVFSDAVSQLREDAQAHAETCRAMPNPNNQ